MPFIDVPDGDGDNLERAFERHYELATLAAAIETA
jgi:hypothetical protein